MVILGSIKKEDSCYKIYKTDDEYITEYSTYEEAYYVRQELQKNDWDTSKIKEIEKGFPEYYTELLYYWQYIHYSEEEEAWFILVPKAKSPARKLEHLRYSNVEDALFERDFLVEHGWDYEVLVECIDDTRNPYYIKSLPPYPKYKIRNIQQRKSHKNRILLMQELILEDNDIRISEVAEIFDRTPQTIRQWLRNYNTNYTEFKSVVLEGKNPLEEFTFNKKIYKPTVPSGESANYVYFNKRGSQNPYGIIKNHTWYGYYPTRELADKIVADLQECNWDKKMLPSIQAKYGFQQSRKNNGTIRKVGNKFSVRKHLNKKETSYGTYKTKEIAERIREELIKKEWDKEELLGIQSLVAKEFGGVIY